MLSKPFQPSRWSEECHQFRRSNPITLLEKSLKPQCQWSLRMKDRNGERQTREQETECQNCLPLDDLYSLNYKTRPAAKVNSCRHDNEQVNFHLCSGVYAYHSLFLRQPSLLLSDINPASLESGADFSIQHLQL